MLCSGTFVEIGSMVACLFGQEIVCLHCRVNLSDCLSGCVGSRGCGSKGIRSSNGGSSCCLLSSVLSKKYVRWC